MKKIIAVFTLLLLTGGHAVLACDLCKNNQPEGLENITHGTGPTGIFDYIITWSAAILVGITLFLSIKYLIKPRESNPDHIKNIVLHQNQGIDGR